jgi:hypothetical protein
MVVVRFSLGLNGACVGTGQVTGTERRRKGTKVPDSRGGDGIGVRDSSQE